MAAGNGTRPDAVTANVVAEAVDVLDSIDIPIVVVNRACHVTRFNRAASNVLSILSSDVGCQPSRLQALADVPEIEQWCQQVMADEVPTNHDLRYGDRWFLIRISPYAGTDRQVSGAILAFTNTTAFRASLGQAIYEREYTKTILNAVIDPLVVLGEGLRVETANRAFYDWFGASREQTQGIPLRILGDDRWNASDLWSSLQETLTHNREFPTIEFEGSFPNIGRRTVLLDARHLGRDGNALVLLAFRDITERKRAEQALGESEKQNEFLGKLIRSAAQPVVVGYADGRISLTNNAFECLTGFSADELRSIGWVAITPVEWRDLEFEKLAQQRLDGLPVRYEKEYITKSGSRVPVELLLHMVPDAAGAPEYYYSLVTDISARKQAEQAAREADRRKDAFLATLSHELRNPLAPIRTAALLLQSPNVSEEDRVRSRAIISRQVIHMASLLDDLLDLSRVSRGAVALKKTWVDLNAVLEAAVETAQPLMDAKKHRLQIDAVTAPVQLHADAVRLTQVVSNLLTNAAKYTDPGGKIALKVCVEQKCLSISVLDNGVGIAPEMQSRIFDMFSQVEPEQERAGGLGIGLALAKGLVELHDGELKVTSGGREKGAEFTVTLPLECAAPSEPIALESGSERVLQTIPSRRIVIADDNRDGAAMLAMLLELDGHETHLAHDGAEAFEVISSVHPQIAILDIGMPGLNGYELAARIRAQPWGESMILIAVTGWGDEDHKQATRTAGFNHHFTKPVDPSLFKPVFAASNLDHIAKGTD
jgi:PAS domain S-box-containing protein